MDILRRGKLSGWFGEEERVVGLLGLEWDQCLDNLRTRKVKMDSSAHTKRGILSTIASQFDLFNFNLPLFNRSRLFMQEFQCTLGLGWDDKICDDKLHE